MTITWNTGSAAARFRSTRKKIEENRKKNKPAHKELEDHELQNIEFLENKEAEESGPKR